MPWHKATKNDDSQPSHYEWPGVLPDAVLLGHKYLMEYAKGQRKEIGQIREMIIIEQKRCGEKGEIQNARFLSDIGADLMKQYRGWDAAIKLIVDEKFTKWPHPGISEQITPYVDEAFYFMDLQS